MSTRRSRPSRRQGVHTEGVAQFEGYEHAYYASRYRWEAIRAGFHTRLLEPSYHYFFDGGPPQNRRPPLWPFSPRASDQLRRSAAGRRAYLAWLNHVKGGVQLGMVATKPISGTTLLHKRALRDLRHDPDFADVTE